MTLHLFFDLLSCVVALLISWKWIHPSSPTICDEILRYGYYTVLLIGFFIGAFGFGTLNTYYSTHAMVIGKSVLGALFGGIIATELFKYFMGIRGSTGAYFVPSLSIGIAIGRIGCSIWRDWKITRMALPQLYLGGMILGMGLCVILSNCMRA